MGAISSLLGGYGDDLARALGLTTRPYASTSGIGAVDAGVAATVVAAEYSDGILHRTVLTLTNVPQAVVNSTEYQGTKLYTFPEGRISVLGSLATLQQKTTSVILSTLNGGATGAVALGTATASNTTLSSTMVNLLPSTAFTTSTVINVAGTAVSAALAAAAQFDGTGTAIALFLNSAYATTGDVDADATQTWTGTVQLTWFNAGDY